MPDLVLNAMHRAAPNIYEGELIDITDSILSDLGGFCWNAGSSSPIHLQWTRGMGSCNQQLV